MPIVSSSLGRLRETCSRNNLRWLRSFGCVVEKRDGCVRVWNDSLDDYRAWIVEMQAQALDVTHASAVCADAATHAMAVYLESPTSKPWTDRLTSSGFERRFRSVVRVLRASGHGAPSLGLQLAEISGDEVSAWAAVYSRLFSTDPKFERQRWELSLQDRSLHHYVFRVQGKPIGLCQLYLAEGVAGLYSVGLLPPAPRGKLIQVAARLILAEATDRGYDHVYFERARRSHADKVSATTRVLRDFEVWMPREGLKAPAS